jgi:hypothetical protein
MNVVDVLVGYRPAGRFVEEELGFWIISFVVTSSQS